MSRHTLESQIMIAEKAETVILDQSFMSLLNSQLVDTSPNTMKGLTHQGKSLDKLIMVALSLMIERKPQKTLAIEHQFTIQ